MVEGSTVSEFNLQAADGVLEWARDLRDCERNVYIRDEQMEAIQEVIGPQLHAIARAMRLASVWDKHADKLRRFTAIAKADQPHYATVNRHTLSKALREFIADMAGAEEEPHGT